MFVTDSGIVMLVRPVQSRKAPCPMLVIVDGMTTEPFAGGYATRIVPSLFRSIHAFELKDVLPDETLISVSSVHPEMA